MSEDITAENGDLINKMIGAREVVIYTNVDRDNCDKVSITVTQTTTGVYIVKMYAIFGKEFEKNSSGESKYKERVLFKTNALSGIGNLPDILQNQIVLYPEIPPNCPPPTIREILARGAFTTDVTITETDTTPRYSVVPSPVARETGGTSETKPAIIDRVPCRGIVYCGIYKLELADKFSTGS